MLTTSMLDGERIRHSCNLDRSIFRCGRFLDQLIDANPQVNSKKSAMLLRLTKGFAQKSRSQRSGW